MSAPASRRWILALVTATALAVAGLSLRGAVAWYGSPSAGVLIDPDGVVSSLGLPSWEGVQQGLRYPDRLIEVEGRLVGASAGHYRSAAWDDALEEAVRAGRPTLRARFETREGQREIELPVRPLEPMAWWLFAGTPMIIASLYVMAALIAVSASPRGKLARTFAKTALSAALFLFTLFDYHSARALVPFFLVAYALVPMSFFMLPLRLPDDAPLVARRPWLTRAADAVGLSLAAGMLALLATGRTTVPLRDVCALLFGASFLFFVVTFLVRFARARGDRRRTLRALLFAMVPPHAVLGLCFLLAMMGLSSSPTILWCTTPALILTPLATVFAFVRYDLWGSRALLSRPLTRMIIAGVMLTFTVAVCAACAPLVGVTISGALKVAGPAAVLGAGLVVHALRAGDRTLFPARASYKPTIEQLSEELTLVTDPDEVAGAVERTVRRWLPCEKVAFRRVDGLPQDGVGGAEASGERAAVARPADHAGGELVLTVAFRGQPLGVLEVGPKPGGALFTSEDLDLLRTIANQAAVALAHALSYAELERRRREQAAAWRDEREALIETLAAEISHEVRYPINFFRSIFSVGRDSASAGRHLDAEEVEIGCEEVERLERLVLGLRRVTHRRLERRALRIEELCTKAEMLLRDQLGSRRLSVRVEGPSTFRCDPDQVTQVLVNLLSNGLDAAGERGEVGVTWSAGPGGAELVVWDTGPGIAGDPARIFAPWYTTKPRGTGLGLAITHRLVRAHGWSVAHDRREGRTRFVVSIPASDVSEAAMLAGVSEEEVA